MELRKTDGPGLDFRSVPIQIMVIYGSDEGGEYVFLGGCKYRPVQETSDAVDFTRCSGMSICSQCGREYYDHPSHSEHGFLKELCDGRLVKL